MDFTTYSTRVQAPAFPEPPSKSDRENDTNDRVVSNPPGQTTFDEGEEGSNAVRDCRVVLDRMDYSVLPNTHGHHTPSLKTPTQHPPFLK